MYKHNQGVRKKSKKKPIGVILLLIIISASLFVATAKSILSFPVISGTSEFTSIEQSQAEPNLPWPKYGQSSFGAVGYGVLESKDTEAARPTASVAKVMTVLAILEKHPLQLGEQGPMIKFSQADEDLFSEYWAKNGTSVRVAAGQEISLYQALQYIMIPSANNVADTAAVWAFGSMEEYTKYADNLALQLGMKNSHFADGSGFSPKTVSTADDLVLLGIKAIQNPVIAEIARTWEVQLPDGSKAQNSNVFLDFEGNRVIGIKTGDTDQAGGVYLNAMEHEVEGQKITMVTAVMGAKSLTKAEKDAIKIANASKPYFSSQKIVEAGQKVGSYKVPWQNQIDVISQQDIYVVNWPGHAISPTISLSSIDKLLVAGSEIGDISFNLGNQTYSSKVATVSGLQSPSTIWRLKRYL